MNKVVRREGESGLHSTIANEILPSKTHIAPGISVTSQLSLGVEPRLQLAWTIAGEYWSRGYTLMVFHSTTGFSPQRYPEDLNDHGRLVIEMDRSSALEVRLEEGTHFYTFLLYKKVFLGFFETSSMVRFSESVPSVHVALGRIRDQLELEELRRKHEVGALEYEARIIELETKRTRLRQQIENAKKPQERKVVDPVESFIADELTEVDAMFAGIVAKRKKIAALKADPAFKNLSRKEQKAVIQKIEDRFDPAEMGARREVRGR